jgi:hypothetical protein
MKRRDAGLARHMGKYAEIGRIINMPIVREMTDRELEAYNKQNLKEKAFDLGWRLFPVQAEALAAYELENGLFGPIPVGFGKTLLTLMIGEKGWQKGFRKILLLVPPEVLSQLVDADIRWAKKRTRLSYPIHVLGGKTLKQRRKLASSGRRGVYIMPYSLLSTQDTIQNLKDIAPELIICDEAHLLANKSAARTRRLMKYVEQNSPEGVAISGTITGKSVRDYYHLIKWCLGEGSPMPNSMHLANEWSQILDAEAMNKVYLTPQDMEPITPVIEWARTNYPDEEFTADVAGARRAYQKRFASCPGVVISKNASIGTSLVLANQPVSHFRECDGWEEVERLGKQVTDDWVTPNGDEIDHAIHCYKWLYEIYGAGFYNELSWPDPEVFAKRRRIPVDEAEEILFRAKEHHQAGQTYTKALRRWFGRPHPAGLDTPFLVGQDMMKNGSANVGERLYDLWREWKDLDFEDRPDRDSTAVRLCSFKIDAMVEWAKGLKGGGLVWVHNKEMGIWAVEELLKNNLQALHCPAGEVHNVAIRNEKNGDKIIVASMTAHGTGKNLQHFQDQYFLQWPRSAKKAEQVLGRTHRNGQKADRLIAVTNNTLDFDRQNFAATLNDSLYIHQTTGSRQKLMYATYDPLPIVFPAAVLRQRGFENRMLTEDQQSELNDRFGQ